MLQRSRNAAITALGLLLPLALSWIVLVYTHQHFESSTPDVKTPNPAMIPARYLGPADWLVFYDPWFAGVFGAIYYPWCAVYLGAIGATAALRPASLSRRPRLLFVAALAIGSVLASPWLYLAARELIT